MQSVVQRVVSALNIFPWRAVVLSWPTLIELAPCDDKIRDVWSVVRLSGDREEVADLILRLSRCQLGSGQTNIEEHT